MYGDLLIGDDHFSNLPSYYKNKLYLPLNLLSQLKMTSKNKVLFNLNLNAPIKVKLLTLHPRKQWAALITTNNTFSLWNYRQRILIKSFSCNTLDDSKNFDVRDIIFFDRYSLPYNIDTPMRTNIIFVSPFRIYLYDYLTDAIKQINDKEMEQKNIRKVCVYSQSKICVSLNDGSFKILDSRDLYVKNTMTIKNIRGYHTKPITWLIAYCQSQNQMPRVITVSAQDGLMACWNVDTLLHTPQIPDPASPSFKFIMQKGGKNDSNNGQQIISLQYDNSSYRLITLTESYITIWSTMTGMELRRLKNNKYKQIVVFNHFSFGANCFIVHSGKSQLVLLRPNVNQIELEQCFDLRNVVKQPDSNISCIKTLPQNPSQVFICSQSGIVVIEINKFYRPSYGFHQIFVTRLTTLNSKEFIIRSEGCIKSQIQRKLLQKMHFEQDILFNSFFLSFQAGWINFNLMQIQFQNMLFEQRKYKMHKVAPESPLSRQTNSQALIQVRFDGREFLIFNPDLGYFQIFGLKEDQNQESLLGLDDEPANIDFYSKFVRVEGGHARDIVWHQYKTQFGAIKGFDKNDKIVEYVNEKSGFFGRGERQFKLSGQIVNWHACIYGKNSKSNNYQLLIKTDSIKSKLYRIHNFGLLFGYSSQQSTAQVVSFINNEKLSSFKEIEGNPIWPQRVFVSFCESYQIFVYDGQFVIYRMQESGQLNYFRSVQQTIHEGLFWQKFFFFSTKSSIFFMQITLQDILLIKLADSKGSAEEKGFNLMSDDLEQIQLKLPEGQLQFLSIVNYHLLMLNHSGQKALLNLKVFPYVQFCIQTVLGNTERLSALYKNSNKNLQRSMKQTLYAYGLNVPQIK